MAGGLDWCEERRPAYVKIGGGKKCHVEESWE